MSRLGYWCRSCGCFRENIEDMLSRHILAAKDGLCTEGENPFGNGVCPGFATFEEARKRGRREKAKNRDWMKSAAND